MGKRLILADGISPMSIPINLRVVPSEGAGDADIAIQSAEIHTGRLARNSVVTGSTLDGLQEVTINVTEEPKPLFVELIVESVVIGDEGGTIQARVNTNASYLTYDFTTNAINIPLPATYQAAGQTVNNGDIITGDPGATTQFTAIITLQAPSTTNVQDLISILRIIPDGTAGLAKTFHITQSGANPYLFVNEMDNRVFNITLGQDGNPVTVPILSNTNWTFE